MEKKPDSKRMNKLLDTLGKINDENVVDREAVGFFSRLLLLCTLPHSNPGDNINVYSRKTNNIHLGIQPGFNMKTQKSFGVPYGVYPRLLLAFITTEVKKKKSPKIKLGKSLSEFMGKLGLEPSGGRWGNITPLKNQMDRLFNSRILIQEFKDERDTPSKSSNLQLIESSNEDDDGWNKQLTWWKKTHPNQEVLFDNEITLSDKFFEELSSNPVPIDLDILGSIRKSPLAIDLYLFLTYRTFTLRNFKKKTSIPWASLHKQFGADYKEVKEFSRECKKQLNTLTQIYRGLNVDYSYGNLVLLPSTPSVPPKMNV